jgi:hypothetical protein
MKSFLLLLAWCATAVVARIPFDALTALSVNKQLQPTDENAVVDKYSKFFPDDASLCEQSKLDMKVHGPLLKDIEMLSDILADVVQRGNPRVHDLYCKMRQYGLERASDLIDNTSSTEALQKMITLAQELNAQDALGVMELSPWHSTW